MKEIKLGDDSYRAKGLEKLPAWVTPKTKRFYERAAIRKNWSLRQYLTHWLTKNAPK